jgi:hypothetical protein
MVLMHMGNTCERTHTVFRALARSRQWRARCLFWTGRERLATPWCCIALYDMTSVRCLACGACSLVLDSLTIIYSEGHHITDKEEGDEYVGDGEWFADF